MNFTRTIAASALSIRALRDQLASASQHQNDDSEQLSHWSSVSNDGIQQSNDINQVSALAGEPGPRRKFCIGIDWGTTFTSISYHVSSLNDDDATTPRSSDIKTIHNWPGDTTGNAEQVPTEIWYPAEPITRHPPYEQFDIPLDFKNGTYCMEEKQRGDDTAESESVEADNLKAAHSLESGLNLAACEEGDEVFWGYLVSYHRDHLNTPRDRRTLVERPKLMLLSTDYTQQDRRQLRQQIQHLVKNRIIGKYGKRATHDVRDIRDVITDFLIKVFEHTKEQLKDYEDFTDNDSVEFIIAVPTVWSSQASRVLQQSVEAAIRASSFGRLVNNSLVNLFIVPEQEAGATWMLQRKDMATTTLRAVVACLDCGGGTVDGATYEVGDSYPLRLGAEVLEPTGDNCGGSYLNDNFKKHLQSRLRFETYLLCNDNTLESIINRVARDFEVTDKPRVDVMTKSFGRFRIENLRGDQPNWVGAAGTKRFLNNILLMDLADYEEIYLPILGRVWMVLKGQLDAARFAGLTIKIVFLIGGFAACPSLISVLKAQLKNYENEHKFPYRIRLIEDKKRSVAAVSAGAVLRALDKANGPRRIIQSSYGFLRREPHDQQSYKGHKYARPYRDPDNQDWYVEVINYFLIKGSVVPGTYEFEPIKMMHTFPIEDEQPAEPGLPEAEAQTPKLLCHELLFVSDTATESHYPFKGFKNRDAQIVGRITTDVTSLKTRNLLEIVEPERDRDGKLRGKSHYKVEYDLVPMIRGRDLIYESRWPSSDAMARVKDDRRKRRRMQKHEFTQTAQISIAAAFMPGTS